MSTGRAIQTAAIHTALGVAIGVVIEGMLPSLNEDASLSSQVFEIVVQLGMNGAALASLGTFLSQDDPTFGIPFSFALFQSQSELRKRIDRVAGQARSQVSLNVQRMVPQKAAV